MATSERQPWQSWREHAECRGMEHIFYSRADERGPARERRIARSKAVCATCPVIEECRRDAVPEMAGSDMVVGGLDPDQMIRYVSDRRVIHIQ